MNAWGVVAKTQHRGGGVSGAATSLHLLWITLCCNSTLREDLLMSVSKSVYKSVPPFLFCLSAPPLASGSTFHPLTGLSCWVSLHGCQRPAPDAPSRSDVLIAGLQQGTVIEKCVALTQWNVDVWLRRGQTDSGADHQHLCHMGVTWPGLTEGEGRSRWRPWGGLRLPLC